MSKISIMSNRSKPFNLPSSWSSLFKREGSRDGQIPTSSLPSVSSILSPLSMPQLQNIVASIDTDLSVTEQILAGLQARIDATLQNLQHSLLPVGSIFCFGGSQAPPNYHLCDGSAFSKEDYPDLFGAIGSNYTQSGVDSLHYFNIPDLRGMFVRGCDYDRGVDTQSKRPIGSVQPAMTGSPNSGPFQINSAGGHQHTTFFWYAPLSGSGNSNFVAVSSLGGTVNVPTSIAGAHTHTFSGGDAETCPINVALNYIIKIV